MASHPEFSFATTASEVAAAFPESIQGKTILITGVAPNGIGETTAAALAEQSPATLILTGRTASKVDAVINSLKPRFPSTDYVFLEMDLSSLSSVRKAALTLNANPSIPTIDILINNAGVMAVPDHTLTSDGIELQFATNHIGHFLFTNLILPKLIAAASSDKNNDNSTRIINVSSYGHRFGPIRFSDPNFHQPTSSLLPSEQPNDTFINKVFHIPCSPTSSYHPVVAYAQSKTANILFSLSLNLKLASNNHQNIQSFALHPGSINTELQRHLDRATISEVRKRATQELGTVDQRKSREQGASTTLVAALDPALKMEIPAAAAAGEGKKSLSSLVKGIYLTDCQVQDEECEEWARDMEVAERLWELSERLVGEKFSWWMNSWAGR